MRKKIVAILLIATMAMGIAACGGSGDKKDDNTITVWCWDKTFNIFAMEEAAKIYQEDHQDVKIDIVEVGDVDVQSRLTTAGISGDLSTLPDVFLMLDQSFQKNVISYPDIFTEISEKKIDFSEFAPGKTDFSVVDGKHYGVPFDNGVAIACYRTDILQEAGMTLEDFTDITWDEWIEKGKVVLEKTGKPLLTTTAGECDLLTMMLQSAGASLFNEDGTTNIAKNDTLKKVIDTYCKMKDSGVLQEVNNWDEYTGSMLNSEVAGVINGCWIMGTIQTAEDQSGKWAIVNMPKLDGVDGATNYANCGGASWAVSSNCKNTDLAFDFLNATFGADVDLYDDLLVNAGAIVLKFWMQIDKDEQARRFKARQENPKKQWKITDEDWRNREKWDEYEVAVNEMLQKTNTEYAPWHILESVDKKYARIKALKIVIEEIKKYV